jgi:hypothetical protein
VTGAKNVQTLHEAAEEDWMSIPKEGKSLMDKQTFCNAWLSLAGIFFRSKNFINICV